MQAEAPPLVLHVLHSFATGGTENGVANLINHMPMARYRHAVLALTDVTDFRDRVQRSDVAFVALHKRPGQTAWQFHKLFQVFRELRPQIVHTRNLAALETQFPAWAARVPVRIHGEHGLDLAQHGSHGISYTQVRRFYRPWVQHYTAVSGALCHYLEANVHVPPEHITQVHNGVDGQRFHPGAHGAQPIAGCPFHPARHWLVGSVGRMHPVKDPVTLARAFVQALTLQPALRQRMRLVMVGEGPLRAKVGTVLGAAGLAHLAWLPGERDDVPAVLRGLHAFVLPSLSEGISNAVLEAMASGLPVVATQVGGNAELVQEGQTGYLVGANDAHALAARLVLLAGNPAQAAAMGAAGRQRMEAHFSLEAMVRTYQSLYDTQLRRVGLQPDAP